MARKGNQQRNGVDRHASNHKKKVSDSGHAIPDMKGRGKMNESKVLPGEEIPNGYRPCSLSSDNVKRKNNVGDDNKTKQTSGKFQGKEKQGIDQPQDLGQSVSHSDNSGDCSSCSVENADISKDNGTLPGWDSGVKHAKNGLNYLFNGLHLKTMMENVDFSGNVAFRNLRASTLSILKVAGDWLERHRPLFARVTTNMHNARDYVKLKAERAYPVVLKWLIHFRNIMLLLAMIWLDCTFRGIDSFMRLGTATFFSAIWCSIISVIVMVGMSKFLIALAIAAFVGVFIGLTLGLLVVAISGTVFLWLYGSFWTTIFVIIIGGLAFMLSHERLALLITTVYSVYCAWTYVGWLGLILALYLSFISSDVLIFFLKNNINQRRSSRSPEQSAGVEGQPGFFNNAELTSEEEVIRLLNCTDHYSVLGLSRYENVDVSLLKREYRKKAMLVHPDKNMGNEKAAEAFKKLQNAYEVLLDSLKRKAYDDELRREELLNYFRKSTSQKNGEHGFFASGFAHSEAEGEDPFGESRRIACKKCNNFHVWIQTKKSKSRARWCQVDAPTAYVCADGKIYDATEWYICQGMRCPANTHKPSFHVNTSVTAKHNTSKGSSSGQRSGRMPTSNMEETMTEEEFFEWFQNAVQAGVFDNFNGGAAAESPSPKSSGNGNGSNSGNKRKKKGKKQW
ncbi:hypothetical protein GH714_007698 [Hevea brasiliensis]|uniref:J domain-containing protein n=1 Tax=Hevea brasiliensis TaxID=3981 RepID=A0A6A6M987_HEVBR|nr:hypothetical protein GH714_007698 [Hevea brasiliensis]